MSQFQLFGHKNPDLGFHDPRMIFCLLDNGRNGSKLANENARRKSGFERRMKNLCMNKLLLKLTAAIFFTLGGIFGANAQSNFADFRAHVSDDGDKGISGVTITLEKEGIMVESDTTDHDGRVG